MKVTRTSRLKIRFGNLAFVALFLGVVGLLAWLSTRHVYQADWTMGARNTLSVPSRKVLDALKDPIEITAYASERDVVRKPISEIVARYQRYKRSVNLSFVSPSKEPQRARDAGISVDGEIIIAYQGRQERLQDISEEELTNAMQRLARSQQRWVAFLTGHGERDARGEANHDLGLFGQELTRKGLKIQPLNLVETPAIPDNVGALVVASPQIKLLPGEVDALKRYVAAGGNLLWLQDPGPSQGLEPLADALGVHALPGVVVDTTTQLVGIDNPAFAVVVEYPAHPLTRNFRNLTLFPMAAALDFKPPVEWAGEPILSTLARAWTETGEIKGEIQHDADHGERAGPLVLGVALTREMTTAATKGGKKLQRVAVIGDGDFISNAFLGNAGNLDLGLAVFNWLAQDDALLEIPAKTAPDGRLELSRSAYGLISVGFQVALPLALVLTGVVIWMRRRKR